jgi:hypothetical protein
MKDRSADNEPLPVTQGKPYTPEELALIEELAHRRARKAEIGELFPNRTVAAVKQQIVSARHRLGLTKSQPRGSYVRHTDQATTILDPDDPGYEDGWERRNRKNMAMATRDFLQALQAV